MLAKKLCLLAAPLLALLTTACTPGSYNGGGWVPSRDLDPDHKANFGFVMHADDMDLDGEVDDVRGQLQYQDPYMGVRVHADVVDGGELPATILLFGSSGYLGSGQLGGLAGTYTPQPASLGAGGNLRVGILPITEGPATGETYVRVEFLTGVYSGYVNGGMAQGNVQFHPDD